MKSVTVVKIGSLRDPNEETRGRIEVRDIPEQPLGDEDVRNQKWPTVRSVGLIHIWWRVFLAGSRRSVLDMRYPA